MPMTPRSLDQISDDEFFRIWDGMAAFLAQHGRPLLTVDGTVGSDEGDSEEESGTGASEAEALDLENSVSFLSKR